MSPHGPLVFRQRVCHWPTCGTIFYLCRRCDRGQRYCSSHCRQKALRLQRRQANRRHQQTPEGRADHRDRQREYRQRGRVTDKSSQPPAASASVSERAVIAALPVSSAPSFRRISGRPAQHGWVVCQICGRRGRWVDPFPCPRR
jgi:hypothetical protein